MLREFQGKCGLNYNFCELGTLALENILDAELLLCPWVISRWMIFIFFFPWFKWWKAQTLWILVSKMCFASSPELGLAPQSHFDGLVLSVEMVGENASFWAASFTKHFSYLKIFRSKKSERAILQHKGEQEKCRALMVGSAGGKIHPTVLESSALEHWGGKSEMQLSWSMSSRENSFLA